MYRIIFSVNNNEEVMVLPAVPEGFEVPRSQNNDTYSGLTRDYNRIGTLGLREIPLESFFPVGRRYAFMPSDALTDGWQYVSFFDRWRERRAPFRMIVLDSSGVSRLNMACTVDAFSWKPKRNGDIGYSMTVREYPFVGV